MIRPENGAATDRQTSARPVPSENDAPAGNGSVSAPAGVCIRDRVWWSDVDKMGVMYFGRYIRFAEIAETEFFRAAGYSYDELHAQFGIWLARVHLDVDYRFPAQLDDEIVCRAQLVKVAGSSIHFCFSVERARDAKRLADIGLTVACLDAATLRTTRIPAALRERLNDRLDVPAAAEARGVSTPPEPAER